MALSGFMQRAARATARLAPELEERWQRGEAALSLVDPIPGPEIAPGLSAERLALPGIDLRVEEQLARLQRWQERGRSAFDAMRYDPTINLSSGADAVRNGSFSTPDAEVYLSLIGDRQPRRILEFGSGFSTLIARQAINQFQTFTELAVVEPEPHDHVREVANRIIEGRPEHVGIEALDLESTDMVFIDSSHVVRTGGDVPFLFGEVLPRLRPGTLVHLHDVFLPFAYPQQEARYLWTEQYLLQAYLTHNPLIRVVFTTHLMCRDHLGEMRAAFGLVPGSEAEFFGRSFWFEVLEP